MLNKIDYYFDEQCIYDCFNACYNALWRTLNTEKAMQLENSVKIHELSEQKDEYIDSEMLIDENNLQDSVKTIISEFYDDSEIAGLFMNSEYIHMQIESAITNDEKLSCAIELYKNTDLTTLFELYFAQSIRLESIDFDVYVKKTDQKLIEYDNFDYSEFTEMIENELENHQMIETYVFDHIGGEVQSDKEFIDFYYQLTLKS